MSEDNEKLGQLFEELADLRLVALLDWGLSEQAVSAAFFVQFAVLQLPDEAWPSQPCAGPLGVKWVGVRVRSASVKQSGENEGSEIPDADNPSRDGMVYAVGQSEWVWVLWSDGTWSEEQPEDLEII